MNRNDAITIVLVCNDHFSIMLGALIRSIVFNHRSGEPLNIYIISDNFSNKNKKKIVNSTMAANLSLKWLNMTDLIDIQRDLPYDNSSFPLNVYLRLFIPSILPIELKKAIYMDVDMIACKDISELWHIDIGTHPVAAVRDRSLTVSSEWGGITNYKELNLDPQTPYFNSGLLLLNLDIWRQNGILQRIIKAINTNIKYAKFPDQYGINVVLANEIMELSYKWNCYSYMEEKDPGIIHFIGKKPIYQDYDGNREYLAEFVKYLNMDSGEQFRVYSSFTRYLYKVLNKLKKKF